VRTNLCSLHSNVRENVYIIPTNIQADELKVVRVTRGGGGRREGEIHRGGVSTGDNSSSSSDDDENFEESSSSEEEGTDDDIKNDKCPDDKTK
jgi:hypothetical protein